MLKHKSFELAGLKTSGLADGEFVGWASTFGNVDHQGDRVVKGAFAASVKSIADGDVVPILWEHQKSDPRMQVGEIKSAEETDEGLKVHVALDLDTETGRAAYKAVKARRVKSLSIGYAILQATKADDGAQELKSVDLVEVSLVSRPANDRAVITASKGRDPIIATARRALAKAAGEDLDDEPDAAETDDTDMTVGERLVASLEAALEAAKEIVESAEDEGRDLSPEEAGEVAKHLRNARITKREIAKYAGMPAEQRRGMQYLHDVGKRMDGAQFESRYPDATRFEKFDAPEFVKSHPEYIKIKSRNNIQTKETTTVDTTKEQFLAIGSGRKAFASTIVNKMSGKSDSFHDRTHGLGDTGSKALTTSGQVTTDVPIRPDVIPTGRPATSLLDVIPTISRPTPTWRYLRQNSRALAAAPVADGALKPVSVVGTQTVESGCAVIAHLSEPVGKFILGDAPGLQRFVADELVYGLDRAIEAQAISGDGTGANLTGVLNTSGIQVQAFDTSAIVSIRKALTKAESAGYAPSVAVLRPEAWEEIELAATSDQAIAFRGVPIDLTERRIWGLRVVLSTALPVKVGVVLDPAAVSIDIVGPRIDIEWSAESGELFQRNQIQARVEGRFGVSVYQPAAIYRVATAAA